MTDDTPNHFIKVRLPHGERLWVERTNRWETGSGTGYLRNDPVMECGLHWGSEISVKVIEERDGTEHYELDLEAQNGSAPRPAQE